MEKILVKVSSHKEISRKVLSTDGQTAQVRYNNQIITVHHVTCYGKYSNEAWLSEEMYQDFQQNGDPWLNSLMAGCEVSTEPTEKQATILDREQVSEHYVVYTVLSSDGVTKYHTTLVDGIAAGCECPASRGKCYHRATCEKRERFEQAWNAPIVNEMDTVDEMPAQPAQIWLENDLGVHVVEDLERGEFEIEADAIIESERIRIAEQEAKRQRFEAVQEQVKAIEAGVTVEQYRSLERTRYVLEQNRKQREWREQAPLQPSNTVEQTEFGFVPMRRAG